MSKTAVIFLLSVFLFQGIKAQNNTAAFKLPSGISAEDYIPRTAILKVKPFFNTYCEKDAINISALKQVFSSYGNYTLHKIFPDKKTPEKLYNDIGLKYADLSLIY